MPTWPAKTNYATGDVLTAAQMQDIGNALNSLESAQYAAGKNKIINGDFNIWQRGTSFTANGVYNADRFLQIWDGSGATKTITRETFTPGTAPVAGYEGQYFIRWNQSVAGTSGTYNILQQRIEDVRTFAGQTVTLSFWAKASASVSMASAPQFNQNFGSGGSATTYPGFPGSAPSLTTSWQRFSFTTTVPSVSGKTIGTSSYVEIGLMMPLNTTFTIDIWGVQLEAGNTATAFQTATGTLAGELAACQRYYYLHASGTGQAICNGYYYSSAEVDGVVQFPVPMRTTPTLDQVTGTDYYQFIRNGGGDGFNSFSLSYGSPRAANIYNGTQVSGTSGQAGHIASNNASAYLAFSAEL